MDIHALQQIVHQTRDARRKQTIQKFSPQTEINSFISITRTIGPVPIDQFDLVQMLMTKPLWNGCLLEGDSSIPENLDVTPQYTTDVLVIGGGGAGCAAALHAHASGARSS